MEHFKKYFLLYTVIPLLLFALIASYYRFMVAYNYEFVFEGYCDPYTESCFVYCEDTECIEPFYYTWFHRNANELRKACDGLDILSCSEAETCDLDEKGCYAEYCDSNIDLNCEFLTETDAPNDSLNTESIETDL